MSAWPQVRAALIALHLVAITLMALPAPVGGMNRKAWAEPTVQAELDAWAARLGVDRDTFEDQLWDVASAVMTVRTAALKPFRPYYRLCGTHQSWRMFVAPHVYPSRLQVRVRTGKDWQTVYEVRSAEHAWHREQLDTDRMRSAVFRYGWTTYEPTYRQFAKWLADQALADFPDADEVQVRFVKARTPTPEQARAGEEPPRKPTLTKSFRRPR